MGKGSSPRPFSISKKEFDKNWDQIFGNPICDECRGKGFDFDASHFSNKRCSSCNGTGMKNGKKSI